MQNVFNSIKIFAILTKNFHVYTYAEQSNLITRCYTRRFKVLCTCVLNKHHCRFTLWNIYLLFIPFRFPPFLQVTFVRFSSSLFKTNVPPVFFYVSIHSCNNKSGNSSDWCWADIHSKDLLQPGSHHWTSATPIGITIGINHPSFRMKFLPATSYC